MEDCVKKRNVLLHLLDQEACKIILIYNQKTLFFCEYWWQVCFLFVMMTLQIMISLKIYLTVDHISSRKSILNCYFNITIHLLKYDLTTWEIKTLLSFSNFKKFWWQNSLYSTFSTLFSFMIYVYRDVLDVRVIDWDCITSTMLLPVPVS